MPSERRPITDSPWFWVYLFCTAGLVALALMGPRFQARQKQIEEKSRMRQRAAQEVAGQDTDAHRVEANGIALTLVPLFVILAVVFLFAVWRLWRDHFRQGKHGVRGGDSCAVKP